jgi:hypothetical protein
MEEQRRLVRRQLHARQGKHSADYDIPKCPIDSLWQGRERPLRTGQPQSANVPLSYCQGFLTGGKREPSFSNISRCC